MDQRGNGSSRQINRVVGCQMERIPLSRQSGPGGHFARTDHGETGIDDAGPSARATWCMGRAAGGDMDRAEYRINSTAMSRLFAVVVPANVILPPRPVHPQKP
jgi:hypothetical protein